MSIGIDGVEAIILVFRFGKVPASTSSARIATHMIVDAPDAKRPKTSPSTIARTENIGCHTHLLNKIIMFARPTYPYIEQLKAGWGCVRPTHQSRKLWGDDFKTYGDRMFNGNYRHSYIAHDPDTPRRHRAWKLNAKIVADIRFYFDDLFWGPMHLNRALKDILWAANNGRRETCINVDHDSSGCDCLLYPERCQ